MANAGDSRVVRIGAWAALAAGASLVVKVAHIFATDGSDQTIHGVLYLGAILLGMLGAAGVGALYGSSRLKKVGLGFLTFFVFVFFLMMLSDGMKAAINAVADVPEYVATEIPVAVAGLFWLVIGYKLWATTERSRGRDAVVA